MKIEKLSSKLKRSVS